MELLTKTSADHIIKIQIYERKDICYRYSIFSSNFFNLTDAERESAVLISDYETWQKYFADSSDKLSMYDEEYFKTKSIVLLNLRLPAGNYDIKVRYLYDGGNTLYAGVNLHEITAPEALQW